MTWNVIQLIVESALVLWVVFTVPFVYVNTPLDKFMFKTVPTLFAIYFAFDVLSAVKSYFG